MTDLEQLEIHIGRNPSNHIPIADDFLLDTHAVISAEKVGNEVQYKLTPKGPVIQKYKERKEPFRLENDTTFSMGRYIFKYKQDTEL
jgi:hypothetical protein